MKDRVKIATVDELPSAEQPKILTREQVEADIAYLQWAISRDEDYVEERHQRLEVLYGLREKMDELEAE
jgi:hypothetical protein